MNRRPLPPSEPSRRSVLGLLGAVPLATGALSLGDSVSPLSLNARIQKRSARG
jgi:hypothetical protein